MATYDDKATLLKLSDTDWTVADPAEDIRGRKVLDKQGEEVGDVDDLFVDQPEKRVRFLQVASGGFLGLGETKFLIPVDAITKISRDAVHINQMRQSVAGAPRYDPDLVDRRYLLKFDG
jgi:sporulation protein YlmC with PRC-barrel domain